MTARGYLLVRAGARPYGLPLDHVIEVADEVSVSTVPGLGPAVRGVARLRERLVPVIPLDRVLRETTTLTGDASTLILTRLGGRWIAFAVDDAEDVVREPVLPVPSGASMPWALGISDRGGELVPVVDLARVEERLTRTSEREGV